MELNTDLTADAQAVHEPANNTGIDMARSRDKQVQGHTAPAAELELRSERRDTQHVYAVSMQ